MTAEAQDQAVRYYRRREGEERLAAKEAKSDVGREAHDNLANCYAESLRTLHAV